jgi:hypothetical protein
VHRNYDPTEQTIGPAAPAAGFLILFQNDDVESGRLVFGPKSHPEPDPRDYFFVACVGAEQDGGE